MTPLRIGDKTIAPPLERPGAFDFSHYDPAGDPSRALAESLRFMI